MRHVFGHQRLRMDRRVRRAAAHGEIVADNHHRAAVDLRPAEDAICRRERAQLVCRIIFGDTGKRADLAKAVLVDEAVDALAYGETAALVLALDLVGPAHLARQRFAAPELIEFGLPVHLVLLDAPCVSCLIAGTRDCESRGEAWRKRRSSPKLPAASAPFRSRRVQRSMPARTSC